MFERKIAGDRLIYFSFAYSCFVSSLFLSAPGNTYFLKYRSLAFADQNQREQPGWLTLYKKASYS